MDGLIMDMTRRKKGTSRVMARSQVCTEVIRMFLIEFDVFGFTSVGF